MWETSCASCAKTTASGGYALFVAGGVTNTFTRVSWHANWIDNAVAGQPPLEATDHLGVKSWMWPSAGARITICAAPTPLATVCGSTRTG